MSIISLSTWPICTIPSMLDFLSSSLTTHMPTFMVEFAVVATLYHMPQAKSGEIVGYRYPTLIMRYYATKLRWLCISYDVWNESESTMH